MLNSPLPYRLAEFIKDVQSRYSPDKAETFWACEPFVRRLLDEGVIQSWFNERLRALIADPHHAGDWRANEVTFHRGNGWSVSVTLFDTTRQYIHALPFLGIYAPLGVELTAEKYKLPDNYRNDVFDPSVRLEAAGRISVPGGQLLRLETDRYAYDFQVPKLQAVLRFSSGVVRPLEWLFSKSGFQAWQANDADLTFTQLRVAAYVLGKIAHQSSTEPLKLLSTHSHHAVRWAAIQNLGRLNRSEALVKIREAVSDPHPHVRRAAQKTLDQLDRRTTPH